jgi:DNA-directed RNA polymerase specialized sigma24 family protein
MAQFPATQWTLIRASALSQADRRVAFSSLVQAYRPAIVAYLRARLGADQAEDAAQSFLISSYEHAWFARADPEFGSFRVFLLLMLKRHAGHGQRRAPLVTEAIDDGFELADASADVDPERAFDARFLMTLTAQALAALRESYVARGRAGLYDALLPLLTSPPGRGDLASLSEKLAMPANTLAVELKRLRSRVAGALRERLGELCVDAGTAERDWQALRAAQG